MSADRLEALRQLYERFNARDIDGLLEQLHPDVDWPNGWEGGREHGREAVRSYWTRQWAAIDSRVEPVAMEAGDDDRVHVTVRQYVRAPDGTVLGDQIVRHVYTFEGELVRRMEIIEGQGDDGRAVATEA